MRGYYAARLFLIFGLEAEAEREAIRVAGGVAAGGVAVGADNTKGRRVARIRGTLPPDAG